MHQYRRSKDIGSISGDSGNKPCSMMITKVAGLKGAESISRHQVLLGRGRQLRVLDF
jgi:hypothetical protein